MIIQNGWRAICFAFALAGLQGAVPAQAQIQTENLALKSGETVDLGNLFWVANCKSLLTGPITVEVMDGPPGVTASVKQQNVIPRKFNCAKEVPGGRLLITAPAEVKEKAKGTLVVRMKYPTKDGERQLSRTIEVTLFP
jgi:ribosomal protein L21